MPELPEVEIIRRGLEEYLVGQEIAGIEELSSKQFIGDPKLVIGARIIEVRRFGKGLVIDFSNGFSIAIHVKMTGQLIYRGYGVSSGRHEKFPNKWTRAVFKIKDQRSKIKNTNKKLKTSESLFENCHSEQSRGISHACANSHSREIPPRAALGRDDNKVYSCLYYNDIRKFGWVRVIETKKVMDLPFFKNLGPEPLRDLDLKLFQDILASSKAPIKSVLMDQHKISGIGNIYANEALFLAKINPVRPASSLTKEEAKRLLGAIEEVLQKGIAAGGSSMTNYVNALGEKGTYQEYFLVYKREGKRCPVCKGIIKKMKIGGRGTFYCPVCQK